MQSLSGSSAARRRAITELLFFASVGDLWRCKKICETWHIRVSEPYCCDYDRRTPLHLAASEGAYKVTEWLLSQGVDVNCLDRFNRTPLEDAVRGEYGVVAKLLLDRGGMVWHEDGLVPLSNSHLAGAFGFAPPRRWDLDPDWELDPDGLQILEKLGEGEFGVVHRARWCGTLVAAKILKASSDIAVGDFRSEVEILRRVHHPNAVQFMGACTRHEPYVLVTELMRGGSLADAFRLSKAFTFRRALEVALDAARGLAYLHNPRRASPILHRDLKPGNLMLSGSAYQSQEEVVFNSGVVKLADFGLSKTLPVNKHSMNGTYKLTGETGSYRYMAPEVFRHEPYNSLVDVYSYSMIVYQLFEHVPPFQDLNPVEAARRAAMEHVRPGFVQLQAPSPEAAEIRALIQDCWAASADARPPLSEVCARLEKVMDMVPRPVVTASGGCCSLA
ncbi:protein kinase [Helicosporidium sp. ATCC 50920]|nr:protein kinase [Helicosporidium sp. ATCC 50920]|eukprot:KDD75764.1 protein kinase [Helicosporidium sp. ATCC 50920]